jgi:hypothetical protein
MLVLFAFKGHFTSEVKSVIHAMDADLVVITGWMTSQLQILDVYSAFQGLLETPIF